MILDLTQTDVLADLRFRFRPMWRPAQKLMSAYLCVGLVPTSEDGAEGEAALALNHPEDHARLDMAMLHHTATELHSILQERHRLLLALPVHLETVLRPSWRRSYLAALKELIPAEAAKFLLLELVGLPPRMPQERITEIVGALRPHCRAVTARVELDHQVFGVFVGTGVLSVGCDVAGNHAAEFQVMQQLGRFARSAATTGIATHVRGIASLSLLAAAVGAGFDYIDGDAVAQPVRRPRRIVNFELADAYRTLGAR